MRSTVGIRALVIGAFLVLAAGLIVWVLAIRVPSDPVQSAHSAVLACHEPAAPALPDGATAPLEQMATARKAFQAYDAAVIAHIQCLDSKLDPLTKQAAGSASAAELDKIKAFQIDAHNAAVEHEQAAVDQFNVQLRLYKAKHS